MISFQPFFDTLRDRGISQYQLIHEYHVSTGTLDAIRKNKSMTLNTIADLCLILNCEIQDIVKIEKP
ncbi:helix-turn-helix domain-containing protein [Candidatus Stoquefichus massiliensis]|uniref:helix-turn-helix domain-containing protein n=1 Tax=Candidatus Stoquefichus massiliensis TaxID=1470350 RepID=UPI000483E0A2|nr:helix-turn-helix transcriptional regulator [Candidatus Stoquefichus massiliensis]